MPKPSLRFYQNIAFLNGMDEIMLSFLNNNIPIKEGYEYLKQYDYYLKDEMIVDSDDPVFHMTIITREHYLE